MFDPISWTIVATIAGAVVVGAGIGYGIKSTFSSGHSEIQEDSKSNVVNNNLQIDENHGEIMSVLYFFVGIVVILLVFKGCKIFNILLRNYYSNTKQNENQRHICNSCNSHHITSV